MEPKKFVAESVAQGLIEVHETLGQDALIVSVEENKNPAGGRRVEILAQPAKESPQPRESEPKATNDSGLSPAEEALLTLTRQAKQGGEANTRDDGNSTFPQMGGGASSIEQTAGQTSGLLKNARYGELAEESAQQPDYRKRAEELLALAYQNKTKQKAKRRPAARSFGATEPPPETEFLAEPEPYPGEIDPMPKPALKPARPALGRSKANTSAMPPMISSLYFYLLDTGIHPEIAQEMIERLMDKYNPKKGWNKARIRQFLGSLVTNQVRVGGGITIPSKRKRAIALIGPTGVGKTTTIAKLATRLTQNGMSVGLLTVDHFRVGAFDQLRSFATALNLPLLAATNKTDFARAYRALKTKQIVLVDTAGQNPRDIELLERLDRTLSLAGDLERHLVLSAPTKERDLIGFVEMYRNIGFDYLLFSKLDETATYGGLLNTYFDADKPFSYFTTGQTVPEDIEEASAKRLNSLLFN